MKLFLFYFSFFCSIEAYSQATCKFYFFQNSTDTPDIELSHLRINAGTNVPGGHLRAGTNDSMHEFLAIHDDYIYKAFRASMKKKFNDNLDTNAVVLLDMEHPMHPKAIGAITDPALRDSIIIYGFKRRIEIARKVLPNAYLGLYGIVVPVGNGDIDADQLKGLRRAKQLGMFDSLDFICPVLYPRFQDTLDTDDTFAKGAKSIRTAMAYAADSLNCGKDIIPLLSLIIYNTNSDYDRQWVHTARAQQYVDSLQKFSQVSAIAYWMAQPYSPVTEKMQWQGWRDSIVNYFSNSLHLLPVSKFGYKQIGNKIIFKDSSINADSCRWRFGDGKGTSNTSPIYTYTANGTYTVRQIVFKDGYCPDTSFAIITVTSVGTGISQYSFLSEVNVYPNPAHESVAIKFGDHKLGDEYGVRLYNIMGELVQEKMGVDTPECMLTVGELPKGIYILSVEKLGECIAVEKLILN